MKDKFEKKKSPDSLFLEGYRAVGKAEKLEEGKQFKKAFGEYMEALRCYKTISEVYPEWNKVLVARRLKNTRSKISEMLLLIPIPKEKH